MDTNKIILMDGSHILRDLLKRVINRTPGLEVVANLHDLSKYQDVAENSEAHWTIMVLPPGKEVPSEISEYVEKDPSMHLMTLRTDGSQVSMKWLEPKEITMKEMELKDILEVLVEDRYQQQVEDDRL